MKLVRILQNVSIPGMPGFRQGQQVRVKDEIADLLVERGHAKLETGKSEQAVKEEEKGKESKGAKPRKRGDKERVTVKKSDK